MRRTWLLVALLGCLAACSAPPPAPTAVPTTVATVAPTAVPAVVPTAAPTGVPTAAPTAAPTAVPTAVPTAAPTAAAAPAALNVQDQAAALRPEFAADLARAGEWNRYTLDVAIDPAARTLTGQMRLEYTNRDSAALDRIYLHLYPNLPDFGGRLDVRALDVDGAPAEVLYEARRYLLRVNLPRPLAPGASTTLALGWLVSAPANASQRLYGAFNEEGGVLALASSFPIAAVVRGGAWDIGWPDGKGDFVNSETALFDVRLRAPGGWRPITTGVVVEQRADGGAQTLRIVSGPQRDFMIALAQFEVASADAAGTRVNSYYRAEDAAGGRAALDAAVKAVEAFGKRYGPYPLRELDVLEIAAGTFLGVEYPGMVMIEQNLYSGDPGLELTVAHEVGHQWWYSQVGNDVQTAAWLDEALASYSQVVYQEELAGPAAAARELDGFRERYGRALALGRDAPVQQPNSQFNNNYVLLVYGKAVVFFAALRQRMGDAAFDRFLHDYYAANRYGYVGGEQLLAAAEGACGCDLHPLYADWITRAVPLEMP